MPFINCIEAGRNLTAFVNRIDKSKIEVDLAETQKSRDIIVFGLGETELTAGQGKTPIAIATFEFEKDADGFFWYRSECELNPPVYHCGWGQRGNSPFGPGVAELIKAMIYEVEQSNLPQEEKTAAFTYLNELLRKYS